MSPFRRSDLFPRERVRDGFPLLYEAISLRSVDRSSHEFPGVSRACNCLSPILHLSRCVAIPDAGDIWLCIKPSERSRRKRSTSREIRDAVRLLSRASPVVSAKRKSESTGSHEIMSSINSSLKRADCFSHSRVGS